MVPGTECKAALMKLGPSKTEAIVFNRKKMACPLRVRGESESQVENFKCLGFVFIINTGRKDGAGDLRVDRCSDHSTAIVEEA